MKTPIGRVFSSRYNFLPSSNTRRSAAGTNERGGSQFQQPQLGSTEEVLEQAAMRLQSAQCQSAMTPRTVVSSLDNMLRVATALQQIMTTVNPAESQEGKLMAVSKIFTNLMDHNDH